MQFLGKILAIPTLLLILLLSLFALGLYTLNKNFNEHIRDLNLTTDLINQIHELRIELDQLIITNDEENTGDYTRLVNKIEASYQTIALDEEFISQPILLDSLESTLEKYLVQLSNYLTDAENLNVDSLTTLVNEISDYQQRIEGIVNNLASNSVEEINGQYLTYARFSLIFIITLIMIGILLVYQLSIKIVKPIRKLQNSLEKIPEGEFVTVQSDREDEIGDLINTFNTMSRKLKISQKELAEVNFQLQQNNKELEAFAYSVSHDLRTPLRSISGFSEELMTEHSEKLEGTALNYLERVHKAALKMGELIDDILKLSRITRKDLKPEQVDLSKVSYDTLELLGQDFDTKKFTMVVQPDLKVYADPSMVKIVMLNLLNNAIKFSAEKNNPVITVGKTIIQNKLYYFVKDNGIGFNMDYADKLYSPFQRLHSDEKFKGSGIGLATVKRIISKHQGEIFAKSEAGKETTFYFNFGVTNE